METIDAKFYAENAIWADSIRLYAKAGGALAKHIVWEQVASEAVESEPFMVVPRESAQNLMDALWAAGLRPSEGTGSAGALAATQAHLKDMQMIAGRLMTMVEK
jgi:hypothetical protein